MPALPLIDELAEGQSVQIATAEGRWVNATGVNPIAAPFLQQFCIYTPEQFGAVGNGVHDDTLAIVKMEAAREAAGGLAYLCGLYGVSEEIVARGPIWYGVSPQTSGLVALASIRSLLRVTGNTPAHLSNLLFDAARQASYGLIRNGDTISLAPPNSFYSRLLFASTLRDGVRAATLVQAPAVGATVQVGPGPAVSFSIQDPLYLIIGGSVAIQIIDGGPLGTATYDLVPNSGQKRILYATTSVAQGVANNVLGGTGPSGVLATADSGLYVSGTTYTASLSGEVFGENNFAQFLSCGAHDCGAVFASAGIAGDYVNFQVTAAPGTVSCIAGSAVVTGNLTTLLATGARCGDRIRIVGAEFPLYDQTGVQRVTDTGMIAQVSSDTEIILDPFSVPTQTVNNVDYAITGGWGMFEDQCIGSNRISSVYGGIWTRCAGGMRFGSVTGPIVDGVLLDTLALSGVTVGTAFAD